VQPLWSDFPQHTHSEARPRERLALENFFWHSKITSDFSDFVFEQVFQRLDQLELHLLRQSAAVVVRLDYLRWPADGTRFNHIGVKCSLHQEFDLALFLRDAQGFFFKNLNEFVADNFALLLGIGDAFEFAKKAIGGIDSVEVQAELVA